MKRTTTVTAKALEFKATVNGTIRLKRDGRGKITSFEMKNVTFKGEDPHKSTPIVIKVDREQMK